MNIPDWSTMILLLVALVFGGAFITSLILTGASIWEESGHPLINSTVTFNSLTSRGWIDTNGVGYLSSVYFDSMRGLSSGIISGDTYNIIYFCDGDGNRRIHSVEDITIHPVPMPTPDPFKCVDVGGGCR